MATSRLCKGPPNPVTGAVRKAVQGQPLGAQLLLLLAGPEMVGRLHSAGFSIPESCRGIYLNSATDGARAGQRKSTGLGVKLKVF